MHPRPQPIPAPEIDDLTLARAQRGEGAAFEVLVRRYQDLVWAYLWRMSGPAASRPFVEDLFQETFLGVHRGLSKFSTAGPARLSTWILSIATRVALYRRRTLLRERPAAAPELERSDGGAAAQGIEGRAMVTALIEALATLSPEHRSIVVLREFHGLEYTMSPKQAKELGLSDTERDAVDEVMKETHTSVPVELRKLYLEMGGDPTTANRLSASTLLGEIVQKTPGDQVSQVRVRLSRERAGLLAPPTSAAAAPVVERALRLMSGLADDFERRLGERIGPQRAASLKNMRRQWGNHSSMSGCPRSE